jgi:CheY-like chemotaxis protein
MLEYLNFQVETATDGEEAIKKYKKALDEEPFEVVIMDLTVPGGMGGKEAINKLKEIDPKVTAIVSSGYSMDPVMANYKEFGFKGVLAKPFKIEDIMRVLNQIFNENEEA